MATAGRILIIPRGEYNAEYNYKMLDLVSYNGMAWISKKDSIGIIPEEGEYWFLMCSAEGKSAYDYAKEGGYTGTKEEFAEKLAQDNPTMDDFKQLTKVAYGNPTKVADVLIDSEYDWIDYARIGNSVLATFGVSVKEINSWTQTRIAYGLPVPYAKETGAYETAFFPVIMFDGTVCMANVSDNGDLMITTNDKALANDTRVMGTVLYVHEE